MKKITFVILFVISGIILFSQVVNTNKPIKGEWDFNKKLLWEKDSAGKNVFGEIQNLAVSENGDVFIADMKNNLIFMFDKNGKFIKDFGKKGEGPGELREYFGGDQLHVTKDRLIFADRALLHYFDLTGKYINTIQFSPLLRPREFINSDNFISAPPTVDTRSGSSAKITLFNVKTGIKKEIASFRPFEKATDTQESGGNQITVGIVIGDITPLMLTKFRNGKIYYGMTSKNEISVCDLNGKKVLSFSNSLKKPNKVSDNYFKELKKRLGDVPANILDNIIKGLPKNASFFSDLHIDRKGNVYLFESDPDGETHRVIDIYDKDGKFTYRGKIGVDEGRTISGIEIESEFIFIWSEDEDGNVVVSKYKVDLPA